MHWFAQHFLNPDDLCNLHLNSIVMVNVNSEPRLRPRSGQGNGEMIMTTVRGVGTTSSEDQTLLERYTRPSAPTTHWDMSFERLMSGGLTLQDED